jgi:IS1 family transposase
MTGVSKNTIVKLLVELGAACTKYQDAALRNLSSKRIQCDEIWSFVGGKDKNISQEKKEKGLGSVWTWTALDADSKLIVTWLVGSRDAGSAYEFMQDVAGRLRNRVQLTTDGHKPYLNAVEDAFGADIDYAVLQKIYGAEPTDEKRYSPAVCLGCKVENVTGSPDQSTFQRPTWSVRTSRCGCQCADSRGSRMPSQKRSRTTRRLWHSTSCTTTSGECIRRFA